MNNTRDQSAQFDFWFKRFQNNMTHDIPNVLKKNYERDKRSGVIPGVEFTFGSCLTEANINI